MTRFNVGVCQARRLWTGGITALMIVGVTSGAHSAYSGTEDVSSLFKRIRSVRDGIRSVEFVQTLATEDRGKSGSQFQTSHAVRMLYRKDLNLLRREWPGSVPGSASNRSNVSRTASGQPVYVVEKGAILLWLFGIPEALGKRPYSILKAGGKTHVEVYSDARAKQAGKRVADISFGATGLPNVVTTYNGLGKELDRMEVYWQERGALAFPEKVVFTYYSRRNTLIQTVTYRDVRLNSVLSASLFSTP